jgi:hypothetical protein
MGEKQIRAQADKAGAEVLGPLFAALGDLAAAAAGPTRRLNCAAAARAEAQQILDAAEAEIVRRREGRWSAWQAARRAGWNTEKLRSAPINHRQPPAAYKPRNSHAVVGLMPEPDSVRD